MTQQDELNRLVEEKIQQKIAKGTINAERAFERLVSEGKIAKDFIAPIGSRVRNEEVPPVIIFKANGDVSMDLNTDYLAGGLFNEYSLHENAITQLSEKLDIPLKYVKKRLETEWGRKLLVYILNTHSNWSDREKVLIRSVGNEIRGILSDHYRRLNGEQTIKTYLEEVQKQGGVMADGYMSDTRLWIETFLPQPIKIPTAKNGDVYIAFGARLSTSDYGDGALELRSFMMQGVCLNGMVSNSILRSIHLGRKLEDNLLYSDKTYQLDTELVCSQIRDITGHIYNTNFIRGRAEMIQTAAGINVDLKAEIDKLNKNLLITKDEGDATIAILSNSRLDDGVQGENTLFKLSQGLSALARNKDEKRKRELEEISGALIERVSS